MENTESRRAQNTIERRRQHISEGGLATINPHELFNGADMDS